jgi:hypothetical protein
VQRAKGALFLIPILVIDIDSIRQKQILPHPSFELIPFTKVWHESQKIEDPLMMTPSSLSQK